MTRSCIVGLGLAGLQRAEARSAEELALEACVRALEDAAFPPERVDGLLVARSPLATNDILSVGLQRAVGLGMLRIAAVVDAKGASAAMLIDAADAALRAGRAEAVLCVFADAPRVAGGRAREAFGHPLHLTDSVILDALSGLRGPVAGFALLSRIYLDTYGDAESSFVTVAQAARLQAQHNPRALFREPLSADQYFASDWVVEPLRRLDCSMPINGGAALLVTRAELAKDSPGRPVSVCGAGQAHASAPFTVSGLHRLGVSEAVNGALTASQISISRVSRFQLYDAVTVLPALAVEELGLTRPGDGRRYLYEAAMGALPGLRVNGGGGQLSGFYLQGMTPVVEAVCELRAADCAEGTYSVAVASGGMFDHHAALVLGV